MKKHFLLAVQTLVTLLLLGWFFHDAEFRRQLGDVVRTADLSWLLIGTLIAGLECFVGAIRWGIFLHLLGIRLPFWKMVQLYFIGVLCNTILVGSVGGDAVKVVYLITKGFKKSAAILSVVMDRISGLAALILCLAIFVPVRWEWLKQSALVLTVVQGVILFVLGTVVVLAATFIAAAHGKTDRVPAWLPGRAVVMDLCEAYFQFVAGWKKSLIAAGVGMVMMILYFLVFYCSNLAFGAGLGFWDFFAFMPAVDVISAMPVSLGGIGVREGVFVLMLGQLAGVPASQAVSISLGGFLMTAIWGLVGAASLPFFRGLVRQTRLQKDLMTHE